MPNPSIIERNLNPQTLQSVVKGMAACGVGVSLGLNSNKEVEVTGLAPGGYALKSGKLRSASKTRVV
jgi:hypothetical protein